MGTNTPLLCSLYCNWRTCCCFPKNCYNFCNCCCWVWLYFLKILLFFLIYKTNSQIHRSWAGVVCVDYLAKGNLAEISKLLFTGNFQLFSASAITYVEFGLIVVLSVCSVVFQALVSAKDYDHDRRDEYKIFN